MATLAKISITTYFTKMLGNTIIYPAQLHTEFNIKRWNNNPITKYHNLNILSEIVDTVRLCKTPSLYIASGGVTYVSVPTDLYIGSIQALLNLSRAYITGNYVIQA